MFADARVKRFMHDNHMSIFLSSLVSIVSIAIVFSLVGIDWTVSLGAVGVLLSFVFFVQKQQLEEARLIKELVTQFNERYDGLNEELNSIIRKDSAEPLESTQKDTLYSYFNLCAEEYLFYRRGYIYPEVWEAWARGMETYFVDHRVRKLWCCESKTGSYYALDFDKVFSTLPQAPTGQLA